MPLIFPRMASSQAPYSVSEGFSNMALNSSKYSRILIDSPLSFKAESRYFPYCLIWRVVLLASFTAESYNCMNFVQKLWPVIYHKELFFTESHYFLHRLKQGVTDDSGESFNYCEGLPLPLK